MQWYNVNKFKPANTATECLVTTKSGAIGISKEITESKIILVDDNNWDAFAKAIFAINLTKSIPESFFNHFYWGKIAEKAYNAIKEI